jgi:hypothetical protein
MRFSTSGFFHELIPYSPQIHTLNIFVFFFKFAEVFIFKIVRWVWYPAGPRRTLLGGVSGPKGRCSAGYQAPQNKICYKLYTTLPWGLTLRKTLFWGSDNCRILFCWSDIPQDFVLWGIIPCWQIKTPRNQTKKFWEIAIPFKGTLFKNSLKI